MTPSIDCSNTFRLSEGQKTALRALVDALLPPLSVPGAGSDETQRLYWEFHLSSDPIFLQSLEQAISKFPEADRMRFTAILSLLATPFGATLLFARPILSFHNLPVPQRTALLQALQHSTISIHRRIFSGYKRLICGVAYSYTFCGKNPFWEAMGYPGAPQLSIVPSLDDASRTVRAMEDQLQLQQAMVRLAPSNTEADLYLECDVLIVGSGAGGSVAASVLSRAGYQVLVVEKGSYLSPGQISNLEAEALDRLFEAHGTLTTTDNGIQILAGSTLGGGTTINWSCCLPLPEHVRNEWVRLGLEDFGKDEYDRTLKYILSKVGASDRSNIEHNIVNKVLQEGCDAMGYQWEVTGQNLVDTQDPTVGYTCFGDRYGSKKSGISVFLRDAAKHDARILDQCRVERILMSHTADKTELPRCIGAECLVGSRRLTIAARKAVVLAAGSIHTPCLLMRSGLRNKHIGKHLRLHPTTPVVGLMNKVVDPCLGAPMTTACDEFFMGPTYNGYGAKIEAPSVHSGLAACAMLWTTPFEYKERLRNYQNSVPLIVLQRDSGEGSVRPDRSGNPRISYVLNREDKVSMMETIKGSLQLLITAGAREVMSSHIRDPGLSLNAGPYSVLRMASDDRIQNYLSALSKQGLKNHDFALYSAHQMGSCRMSKTPYDGAVDSNGETWECENLFVMDASVFPTASGVNPMITIFVIAKMLSSRLALRLRYEDKRLKNLTEASRAEEFLVKRKQIRSFPPSAGLSLRFSKVLPHVLIVASVILVILAIIYGILRKEPVPVAPIVQPATVHESVRDASDVVKDAYQLLQESVNSVKDSSTLREALSSLQGTLRNSSLTQKSLFWTAVFTPLLYVI